MLSFLTKRFIIHRFIPPRSPFDKTNYIDNYVPGNYVRKPRQAKWDDPDYEWPPKMPRYTRLSNRALVQEVETEYLESLKKEKVVPDIKTGDLIQVTTYQSMSGKKTSTFTGVCIGRRRKHTLNSSLNVIGQVDGVQMEMHIKLYSPMVKEVKIVEAGTGNFRSRLNYFRGLTLSKYSALKKGTNQRFKPTNISKQEEQEMRYKILKGEVYADNEPEVNK